MFQLFLKSALRALAVFLPVFWLSISEPFSKYEGNLNLFSVSAMITIIEALSVAIVLLWVAQVIKLPSNPRH